MVSTTDMLRSARYAWGRWRTATSRAMLRALGAELRDPEPLPDEPRPDRELMECFANHGSPMDGRTS